MTQFSLDNPPDDADYRNPNPHPNDHPRYRGMYNKGKDSENRMMLVQMFYHRSQNEKELTEFVFQFGWEFGWSYAECMEAMVDAGYAYMDPIRGAS